MRFFGALPLRMTERKVVAINALFCHPEVYFMFVILRRSRRISFLKRHMEILRALRALRMTGWGFGLQNDGVGECRIHYCVMLSVSETSRQAL